MTDYEVEQSNEFVELMRRNLRKLSDDLKVSDLIYCLRKAYLTRKQPRQFDDKTLTKFEIGSGFEHRVAEILSTKYPVFQNVILKANYDDFELWGGVDIVVIDPLRFYEIKTTRTNTYKQHYITQLLMYYSIAKKTLDVEPELRLLSINVINGDVNEYIVKPLDLTDLIVERGKTLIRYLKNDELPPPIRWVDGICEWCEFKNVCKV